MPRRSVQEEISRANRNKRFRYSPISGFYFLSHDGFIPHSPSIGAYSSRATDVESAGGSTDPLTARAFVSAPASTALVIAAAPSSVTVHR